MFTPWPGKRIGWRMLKGPDYSMKQRNFEKDFKSEKRRHFPEPSHSAPRPARLSIPFLSRESISNRGMVMEQHLQTAPGPKNELSEQCRKTEATEIMRFSVPECLCDKHVKRAIAQLLVTLEGRLGCRVCSTTQKRVLTHVVL